MDLLWEKFRWILPLYMKPISFQSKASVVCSVTAAIFIDFCLKKLNVFSQHIGKKTNEYLNSAEQIQRNWNADQFDERWKMKDSRHRAADRCPFVLRHSLTHWGRVTHICVGNLTIIGSDNGLTPGRRQAIIWTSAGILLIGPKGINFSEILIEILAFSFKKIHLKMSAGKWRPFCFDLNVLSQVTSFMQLGMLCPQTPVWEREDPYRYPTLVAIWCSLTFGQSKFRAPWSSTRRCSGKVEEWDVTVVNTSSDGECCLRALCYYLGWYCIFGKWNP